MPRRNLLPDMERLTEDIMNFHESLLAVPSESVTETEADLLNLGQMYDEDERFYQASRDVRATFELSLLERINDLLASPK